MKPVPSLSLYIGESSEAGFGGTGVPLSGPLGFRASESQRPMEPTALVDSRMFSEPYLEKNKSFLVLDLICLLED